MKVAFVVIVAGAIGFGTWMCSIGAGFFAFAVLAIAIKAVFQCHNNAWRSFDV
jgi:hypothetical protein